MRSPVDLLCAHQDPVVACRARRLLAGGGERSRVVGKLQCTRRPG